MVSCTIFSDCQIHILLDTPSAKPRARAGPSAGDPMLFDDTSSGGPQMSGPGYYTPGYNMSGPPGGGGSGGMNNLFADPMANAAMMYGSSIANQGKDIVNKEVRLAL